MKYPVYVLRDLIQDLPVPKYTRELYAEHLVGKRVFELVFRHEGKFYKLLHKRSEGYVETLESYNSHELIECKEVVAIQRVSYEYVAKEDIIG